MTRKYELKERARSQAETRQRIVEATFELHSSVGPARTTISAIAKRAGVQRLTVYRHFPDDRSLFQACRGHSVAVRPLPDTSAWAAINDPEERLRVALGEIYAFFGSTEQLTANLRRDLPELPVLQEVAAPSVHYWDNLRAVLDRGWKTRGRKRKLTRAVIAHALEFETWRSLVRRHGLDDTQAANAIVQLTRAIRA